MQARLDTCFQSHVRELTPPIAGVLDRPDLDLSKGGIAPKTEDNYGAGETSSRGVTGGGNYR